jgi:energy coupling factor transporter S component ThiW
MRNQYNKTITACFVGYIVQAVVNNFTPLLFLFFQKSYHVPISQITLLVTFNFGIQLLVDLLSVRFIDKIGYQVSMITAHALAAAGLLLLTVLPEILPVPFIGILIAVMIYAIGGGLLEVLVSPVVEACPSDNKEKAMSLLHSFYCWGHAGVVLLSTLFFYAPVQHMVNILCAVTVGPWWALAQAFIASLIRNLLGLGSPLAFPGSMCGALLGGLLYKYGKKLPFAYIGEVVGTGILGGMLSYPVAYLVMGNTAATLFMFVVPFLISTCGGTIIAIIITLPLKKSGMLGKMKDSLEE